MFFQVFNFDGNEWGMQGPIRLTSALKLFCKNISSNIRWPKGSDTKDSVVCIPKNETTGQGLSILNSKYGYPIHHHRWRLLLNEAKSKQVLRQFSEDKTFAVHLWHYLSENNFEHLSSPHSPYAEIISRNCPEIYKECYSNVTRSTIV